MALRKASSFGADEEALPQTSGGRRNTGPNVFMLKQTAPENKATIVVLDDDLIVVCRHKLFMKGDKVAWKLRQTCAGGDAEKYPDPVPRMCIACEASLRDQRIARDAFYYCTIINESKFVGRDGRPYADMKQLLELNRASAQVFLAQKQANGGSLKFCRIAVYRSAAQNSARHGDSWTVKGKINPLEHFAKSIAVERIVKASMERGEKLDRKGAIKQLCTPIDYEAVMGEYKAADAEAFVMFLGGGRGALGGAGEEDARAAMPGTDDDADYAVDTAKVPTTPKKPGAAKPSKAPPAELTAEDEVEETAEETEETAEETTEETEVEETEEPAPPPRKVATKLAGKPGTKPAPKKAPVPEPEETEEVEEVTEEAEADADADETEADPVTDDETAEVEEEPAPPSRKTVKPVAGKPATGKPRPADPAGAKPVKRAAQPAAFEDELPF